MMDPQHIRSILEEVARGTKSPEEALGVIRDLLFADLGIAKPDGHRPLRNGFSEVIFCERKDPTHLLRIVEEMEGRRVNVFGTRADAEIGTRIAERFPAADYDPTSRTFRIVHRTPAPLAGRLAICCAGTADLFVAEEARRTAEFFGLEAARHYDVGVAGLHRLIGCLDSLRAADAIIVVAGMEGALPSVVGGLVGAPIIAVPTSVGYGAHFSGIAPLLAMLNSCSEGIAVVNIDNGFGAACAALRILRNKDKLTT